MSISPVGGAPVHIPAPVASSGKAEGREAAGVADSDGDSDKGAAPSPAAVRAPGTLNVKA